jgi:L-lysine 2,3-aminomutase
VHLGPDRVRVEESLDEVRAAIDGGDPWITLTARQQEVLIQVAQITHVEGVGEHTRAGFS